MTSIQPEIQVRHSPLLYSPRQLRRAYMLAQILGAGRFYLNESPKP